MRRGIRKYSFDETLIVCRFFDVGMTIQMFLWICLVADRDAACRRMIV